MRQDVEKKAWVCSEWPSPAAGAILFVARAAVATEGQGHKATLEGSHTPVKGSKPDRGPATMPHLGVRRGQGCGRGR